MLHRSSNRSRRPLPALLMLASCWISCWVMAGASSAAQQRCVETQTPRRIKLVTAAYPRVAKDNELGGMVELEFTIRRDGSTAAIRVVKSEPEGLFEVSAITALAQWRYEPVLCDGLPVEQRAMVRIKFSPEA